MDNASLTAVEPCFDSGNVSRASDTGRWHSSGQDGSMTAMNRNRELGVHRRTTGDAAGDVRARGLDTRLD